MFLHHVYMFTVYFLSPLGPFATWVAEAAFVNEMSTPFMHLRWFLLESGYKGRLPAILNDAVFFFSFFLCRIVYLPCLFLVAWERGRACEPTAARSSFLRFLRNMFLFNYVVHYSLQLFWFRNISCIAAKTARALIAWRRRVHPDGLSAKILTD